MSHFEFTPTSLKGSVLAAQPALNDPNFAQSLVFIADHDDEGAFGLMLNRPTGHSLGDLAQGHPLLSGPLADVPVYSGGPVQQHSVMIAIFSSRSDQEFDCRLVSDPTEVIEVLKRPGNYLRAFSGYSGWGGGQLEVEMQQESWKVCPPNAALFDERFHEGLWSLYVGEDDRWRDLVPFLPHDASLN